MDFKKKKVNIVQSKFISTYQLDLNTDYLYRTYLIKRTKRRGRTTKNEISISQLAITALYNLAAGRWVLMHEPDNEYYKPKNNFERRPIDSYRANYLHIQPDFILPMAKILDTLEDAVKMEDKENALRLVRGAMSLLNDEIRVPHPKIQKLIDKSPDFTGYFTPIGNTIGKGATSYRVKHQFTPDEIKRVFGDKLKFIDIEK